MNISLILRNLHWERKTSKLAWAPWDIDNPIHTGQVIGVDPGVNYGLAVITPHGIWALSQRLDIPLVKKAEHYMEAAHRAYDLMGTLPVGGNRNACVEGSAFKLPHGEANLAYIRAGFYFGLKHRGYAVRLVPPMTARKAVLGNGKAKGADYWPLLDANAADAVILSLYAISGPSPQN